MLNTCIIEGDGSTRKTLESFCLQNHAIKVAGISNDLWSVSSEVLTEADIIFLDVDMMELADFDFFRKIIVKGQIIFVSSHEKQAIGAFDFGAFDFILKPICNLRFSKMIAEVERYINMKNRNAEPDTNLYVKSNSGYTKINLAEIDYVVSHSDYVAIHTGINRLVILATLKSVENKLPKKQFCRVHRSYIVNLNRIDRLEKAHLVIDDKVIPISRANRESLFLRLNVLN